MVKNSVFKEGLDPILEEKFLSLIRSQHSEQEVDMSKLSELIDLYNYFPVRVKKDKNQSNDIYYQMLSNKKKG